MTQTIRVSLAGHNALTESGIDNYALYADGDNVLIKEKARGSIEVASGDSESIAHGLSYVPFVLVFFESASGEWTLVTGSGYQSIYAEVNTTNLILYNKLGSAKDFKYYIFYDQQV